MARNSAHEGCSVVLVCTLTSTVCYCTLQTHWREYPWVQYKTCAHNAQYSMILHGLTSKRTSTTRHQLLYLTVVAGLRYLIDFEFPRLSSSSLTHLFRPSSLAPQRKGRAGSSSRHRDGSNQASPARAPNTP